MRRTVVRAAMLVAAGAVVGLIVNGARAHGVALAVAIRSSAEGGACTAPKTDDTLVSLAEAAALRGQAGVVFGDTRPSDEYAHGHVAAAIHLPCFASAQASASPLALAGGARTLILYGADDSQSEARLAAEELARRGFKDVRILAGGFRAWQQAGLPAESGPCDQCRKL